MIELGKKEAVLIIPDIHNNVGWVEEYLAKQKYDYVVFLGDYFDEFYDSVKDATEAAKWLKESLKKENRIHLWGNHDTSYFFPNLYECSGYSKEKEEGIKEILKTPEWMKLEGLVKVGNFILSHAGLREELYAHPITRKIDLHKINQNIKDSLLLHQAYYALAAGMARDGFCEFGGVTWLDWNKEFKPIEGMNQIVGHTVVKYPSEKKGPNSVNWNLDTKGSHVGKLINNQFEAIRINSKVVELINTEISNI